MLPTLQSRGGFNARQHPDSAKSTYDATYYAIHALSVTKSHGQGSLGSGPGHAGQLGVVCEWHPSREHSCRAVEVHPVILHTHTKPLHVPRSSRRSAKVSP